MSALAAGDPAREQFEHLCHAAVDALLSVVGRVADRPRAGFGLLRCCLESWIHLVPFVCRAPICAEHRSCESFPLTRALTAPAVR